MDAAVLDLFDIPARQQPDWPGSAVGDVRNELHRRPPLVGAAAIDALRANLAAVAAGEALVVQAGDCAEDPAECTGDHVARKAGLLDVLAGVLKMRTHRPVLRVGRIGGQYTKPRSAPVEIVRGVELPVFRGHMVNEPRAEAGSRRADPSRLLACYEAAGLVVGHLGWGAAGTADRFDALVWTSHEALLLDFEVPMVRRFGDELLLTSTHWPWVGERTRQVDGPHVRLLSKIANPVACKVGPSMTAAELLALCARLDPRRQPGRLTLIARMGAGLAADRLPPLVEAVRAAGHPAIWLCDPMHGNTVRVPNGLKTRYLRDMITELRHFQEAVAAAGGVAGGLHLETTPDEVLECALDESEAAEIGPRYTSWCDPRLNRAQAADLVAAWR
ncbi:MAG TPA: 3-deoxy-7-phosphoheptulonate synthase [Jatrophihabitans sp.]|nr:3-deoxy-7-phosphoheptulonate synthase [Jatrophihabitans sp.]